MDTPGNQQPVGLSANDLAASDAIPFPDELAEEPVVRQRAAVEEQTQLGKDFYRRHGDAEIDGDHMLLTAAADNICWSMYRFSGLADEDVPQSIAVEFAAPLPEHYFLGLADFASDVWIWQECSDTTTSTSETAVVEIPNGLDMISIGGTLYVVVVIWDDTSETIYSVTLTADVDQTAPVAELVIDPYQINRPDDALLDASGSLDRDGGGIVTYEWDWDGDGVYEHSGASAMETINYSECGAYRPVVRVTDGDGNTDTAWALVVIQGWSHTWGLSGWDSYQDLIIGPDGNLYMVGQYVSDSSGYDIQVARYTQFGEFVWRKAWGADESEFGSQLEFDEDGNIYLIGSSNSFEPANLNALIVKLDPEGHLLWTKIWGSDGSETPAASLIDGDGNLHIAGKTSGFGADTDGDLFYLILAPDGTVLSQKTWGFDTAGEQATDMTSDGDDNIYICGRTYNSVSSSGAALLLKLDSAGNLTWQKAIDSASLGLIANAIDLDFNGVIYMCGAQTAFMVQSCLAVIKVNADGTLGWCRTRDGGNEDVGYGIYVSGGRFGPADVLVSGYVYDDNYHALLADISGTGSLEWQRSWRVAEHTYAYTLQRGSYSALFFVGTAVRAAGSWNVETEPLADLSASIADLSGTFQNVMGTSADVEGTLYDPVGTTDAGGGGRDAMIVGWFTTDW
ncbi:hypothetical protein JW859_04205 [bacterium]|nr:hypothetical protein [bacterium]